MTPDEVAEIFVATSSVHGNINHKPTFVDITKFDEKLNSLLVEIRQYHDGGEFRMLRLRQEPSNHNAISESNISKVGKL